MNCKCKPGCKVIVKTKGKKYARGHNPVCHVFSEERKQNISRGRIRFFKNGGEGSFTGKTHSEETKQNLSKIAKSKGYEQVRAACEKRDQKALLKHNRSIASKGGKARARKYTGVPRTEETKKKISKARKKRVRQGTLTSWNKGQHGLQVAWNKGLTKEEHPGLMKLSNTVKAQYASGEKKIQSRGDWKQWYVGKQGRILMRSGLEVNFAKWCDTHGIKFEYEKHRFSVQMSFGIITYTPDFYLPKSNSFVETKGQLSKKDAVKYENFVKQYPNVNWSIVTASSLKAVA